MTLQIDNFDKRIGGILVEDFNLSWKEALELIDKFAHLDFFVEFGTMDNNEVREEIQFGLDDFLTSVDPDHYYRKRQTSLPPEFIMPILSNKGRS